jgi:transmembrane sensor
MSEANREELRNLVERYLNHSATPDERKALERYYSLFDSEPEITEALPEVQLQALQSRIKHGVAEDIVENNKNFFSRPYFWRGVAAAAVLLLLSLALLVPNKISPHQEVAKSPQEPIENTSERKVNRFLTLPDGSTVILHSGSKIKLANDFNEATRTVYLTGEAYFDIAHNQHTPFVIHTGKLKTTVLGTAFTVKAWPQDANITVTVARGKVRVENQEGVVAVLTPEKNVTYNKASEEIDESKAVSSDAVTWLEEEMTFEEMPFGELASRLSQRYGTSITFHNQALALCEITGRFSGTETLNEVLRTLSVASNTQYTYTEDGILIEGEKCM